MAQRNHPRIIAVNKLPKGGWGVSYYTGAPIETKVSTLRTIGAKGQALKKPVWDKSVTYSAGIVHKVIKRRKTLRKLGVHV